MSPHGAMCMLHTEMHPALTRGPCAPPGQSGITRGAVAEGWGGGRKPWILDWESCAQNRQLWGLCPPPLWTRQDNALAGASWGRREARTQKPWPRQGGGLGHT